MVQMLDSPSEWIYLTSNPCITDPSQDHIFLEQAHNIAMNANFAILVGQHYWVFPKLTSEPKQLHSAIPDLATALWDNLHGQPTPQLLWPSMSATSIPQLPAALPPPLKRARQVKVSRYRNGLPISSTTNEPSTSDTQESPKEETDNTTLHSAPNIYTT